MLVLAMQFSRGGRCLQHRADSGPEDTPLPERDKAPTGAGASQALLQSGTEDDGTVTLRGEG